MGLGEFKGGSYCSGSGWEFGDYIIVGLFTLFLLPPLIVASPILLLGYLLGRVVAPLYDRFGGE